MFYWGDTKGGIRLILITARTHAKVWFHEVDAMTGADVGGLQCLMKEAFEAEFHPVTAKVRHDRKEKEEWSWD